MAQPSAQPSKQQEDFINWLVKTFGRFDIAPPRTTPERRPIDWMAHGFGALMDILRRQPINTAVQREETMLRAKQAQNWANFLQFIQQQKPRTEAQTYLKSYGQVIPPKDFVPPPPPPSSPGNPSHPKYTEDLLRLLQMWQAIAPRA